MRSWITEAGLARQAAWVPVDGRERDPRPFWVSVADALRGTAAGSALVRPLTAAPDLDGWAVAERLLADLAGLGDRLWLVVDDAHLLDAGEVLSQLELLVLRASPQLRFVLATLSVPETSSMSRDQAIFVDRATGASLSQYAVVLKIDGSGSGFSGAASSSDR
jgi:ATP/maltotriose-dependent transcriptional regulator MalT